MDPQTLSLSSFPNRTQLLCTVTLLCNGILVFISTTYFGLSSKDATFAPIASSLANEWNQQVVGILEFFLI